MGHRHVFNTHPVVETDNDQGWNYAEQLYMPNGDGSEGSPNVYPMENMSIQGGQFPSQWTPASRSNECSSSNLRLPHYQTVALAPSLDPFLQQSPAANPHMLQDNYSHHPSSSNMGGQTVHGVDSGFYDQTMIGGRGPYKRKSPGVAPTRDIGSTSRYHDAGSSSGMHLLVDPWHEKKSAESYHANLEYPPCYGVHTISSGNEETSRNIRSKAAVSPETNPAGNHLPNHVNHSSSSWSSNPSNSSELWGQCFNVPVREWNRNYMPPTAHGLISGSNSGFFSQDPSYPSTLNNHPSHDSVETGACNNDVSNMNLIPRNVANNLNQPARGTRSGYGQRSTSTFRASSSNFCPGYVDEGQQIVAKGYPSRPPRPSSNLRFRNVDRIGRSYSSSERYRTSTEEGVVVTGQSSFHGSRAMVDQHRDLRLDIDEMSYEELIALGERIGSVSTGLSEGLISKSLTESIHCSSNLFQDDGSCVICLDEYKNMDDVGTLSVCGHDFHVACIRKWLSMKNVCPICKSSAIDDNAKGR